MSDQAKTPMIMDDVSLDTVIAGTFMSLPIVKEVELGVVFDDLATALATADTKNDVILLKYDDYGFVVIGAEAFPYKQLIFCETAGNC